MRLLGSVTEAYVIAEFLRAEIDSPRFGPRVRARLEADAMPISIIQQPDTGSAAENEYRAALLHGYRGAGGSAPLLEGLPESIDWQRVALDHAALRAVRYIDYPYWNELSGGTRSPAVAAQRIRAGETAMGRSNDPFIAVATRLCAGESLGVPILIGPSRDAPLVVLEGHTRVTGMLLALECLPAEIEAVVGFAPGVRDWMYYQSPDAA